MDKTMKKILIGVVVLLVIVILFAINASFMSSDSEDVPGVSDMTSNSDDVSDISESALEKSSESNNEGHSETMNIEIDQNTEIDQLLERFIMAPGNLYYGPFKGEPYSKDNPMLLNAYCITTEEQKKVLSDIFTDYKWEEKNVDNPADNETVQYKIPDVYSWYFTIINDEFYLDVSASSHHLSMFIIVKDSRLREKIGKDLHYCLKDPGFTARVEYMMKTHEISDARKLVYKSEEWEQFFRAL